MVSDYRSQVLVAMLLLTPAVNLQAQQPQHQMSSQMNEFPQLIPHAMAPGIAVPVEYPSPVQFAIPAYPSPSFCKRRPRPYNCPVCPPCLCSPCTPAFFSYCSPCHQKCRCRDINDVPVPLPLDPPAPVQGPAIAIPLPVADPLGLFVPVHSVGPSVWVDDDYFR